MKIFNRVRHSGDAPCRPRAAAWLLAAALLAALLAPASPARGTQENFMLTEHYGGQWLDVEKSPVDDDDDNLCWAAAAANILAWGGWASAAGFNSAETVFDYYTEHWTDAGSLMDNAWRWWLHGYNPSQGASGYAQVTTPGGGFFQGLNYMDYYRGTSSEPGAGYNIYTYLTSGSGVAIAIYKPTTSGLAGHAVTVWGISYDFSLNTPFQGLWITDSDDDKHLLDAPDSLRYYDLSYSDTDFRWRLVDYANSDSWYIGAVQSLRAIPEPATGLLLALAGLAATTRRRR